MKTTAYLPEWKIYLWKKLLLNKEEFDKKEPMVVSFMFFTDEDQMQLMMAEGRRTIDSIQHTYDTAYNAALAGRARTQLNTTGRHPITDEYYNNDPISIMAALVELMDTKPQVLSITARLHKQYIERYRAKKRAYETLEHQKHLASLGMSRSSSGPYKPNDNYLNDPFCDLGESIYKKTEAGQALSDDEFRKLASARYATLHDCLVMKIKIHKPALQAKLDAYIDDFVAGNLVGPPGVQYFAPWIQIRDVFGALQVMTLDFGVKNLLVSPEAIATHGEWEAGRENRYRIFESLFALEKDRRVTISELRKSEVILSVVTADERAALSPESASVDVPKEIKDWASEVYDVVKAHADAMPSVKDDILTTFSANTTRPVKELSVADKKKLYILEKLKEEWELVPKKSTGPTMLQAGLVVYKHRAGETYISSTRFYAWMNQCGIEDFHQLQNILTIFQQEGLIEDFSVTDESR